MPRKIIDAVVWARLESLKGATIKTGALVVRAATTAANGFVPMGNGYVSCSDRFGVQSSGLAIGSSSKDTVSDCLVSPVGTIAHPAAAAASHSILMNRSTCRL